MHVKICGITNLDDALMAAQAGAHYLGYILNYPASPRYVSNEQVKGIITAVRAQYPTVKHVGVFVDATPEHINTVAQQLSLDVAQLHGNESSASLQHIVGPEVWKTIEVHEAKDLDRIQEYQAASAIVFDAGKGSGNVIADDLLGLIDTSTKVVLAGGISPENVVAKISLLQPDIIDVNSGVEIEPGKKDKTKIEKLFKQLMEIA